MNRTIRVTNEMAATGLSNEEMQAVILYIGPWLEASELVESEGMETITKMNPVFSQALTVLGVFE